MLTELLLTPHALSDSDGRDGSDVVRELKNCFFPFAATPTALVCKLGDGEWTREAGRKIALLTNPNHRQLAMSLLIQLVDHLSVVRPAVRRNSEDEAGWIDAAGRSSMQVPLGRIIVSSQSTPPSSNGSTLKEVMGPAFWETRCNPRLVGRDIATQEEVLRAVCTHSDWLLLRLPQIRGGSDDEIVTVKQILRLSNRLPAGFRKSAIDLQICSIRNIPEQNLVGGVKAELDAFIRQGAKVTLTIWPEKHFVNREIIGGAHANTSTGKVVPKPLWWITMTHVAVGSQNATQAGEAGNSWCLFSRQKAHERHEQIKADTAGKLVTLK